jgi:rifampicin phosphotransferase
MTPVLRANQNSLSLDSSWVCSLVKASDGARFGNKAANLARAMQHGLRVPNGRVLSNEAFQLFIERNNLQPVIDRANAAVASGDPAQLAPATELILTTFLAAALPIELTESLLSLEESLASGPWVVRSSACGEDSGNAAFPGMLDSILHVRNLPDLYEAIRRCWASGWSERCLAYRMNRAVDPGGMGVVLQEQVPAVISGVAFSQAPHAEAHILVEYCAGLADGLVSGAVTPGSIQISRTDGRWTSVAEGEHSIALSDAHIVALTEAAWALENLFQHPQDIEWSIDVGGQLFILQSRPITTAPVAPGSGSLQVYSCANMNENYPDPVAPMLYDIARRGYYNYFRNLGIRLGFSAARVRAMEPVLEEVITRHAGRLYYHLSGIHTLLHMAPGTGFQRNPLRQWGEIGRIAIRSVYHACRLESGIRTFEARAERFKQATETDLLARQRPSELVEHLNRFIDIRSNHWFYPSLADTSSMISYGLLKRVLQQAFPDDANGSMQNRLLQGLQDVISAQPAIRLWELSRSIRSNPEHATCFREQGSVEIWEILQRDPGYADVHRAILAYMEEWGFRRSGELMLTRPSFQEDPIALLDILRAYVVQEGVAQEARWKQQQATGDEDAREVLSLIKGRGWFPAAFALRQRVGLRLLIRWTRRSISRRERARHKQALLYSRVRRVALALGKRLELAGDEVFMLTIDELNAVVGGRLAMSEARGRIAKRVSDHERWSGQFPEETLELREGETWRPVRKLSTSLDEHAVEFAGTPACSGHTEGLAAVLHDISEFDKLSDGCILVAAQTDPGWGPAFFRISGLIIERGGMLSHGAILAREYGIPTVVGVERATARIPHGAQLELDGDQGVIYIV